MLVEFKAIGRDPKEGFDKSLRERGEGVLPSEIVWENREDSFVSVIINIADVISWEECYEQFNDKVISCLAIFCETSLGNQYSFHGIILSEKEFRSIIEANNCTQVYSAEELLNYKKGDI